MYTNKLRDFSKRTLANVRVLERQHDNTRELPPQERPAMVTARLGAFLSILVMVREELSALQRDHGPALKTLAVSLRDLGVTAGGGRGPGDQIIAFRNAIAHGNITVEPDDTNQIGKIVFRHEGGKWEAEFSSGQLTEVLDHLETFIDAVSYPSSAVVA